MGRHTFRPFGLAVMMAAMAAPVVGQGSSVYTHSACVSGRGHTAVAAPCGDASSVYYNPAALALMPSALSAGFTAIYNEGSFTYDQGQRTGQTVEREATTPVVPHGYASVRFGEGDRMAVGFGVWAPYGLGIEWPETFEGRYISWKTRLRGIYLQPTLAYQLIPGRLAVGGGPQIVLGGLELNQYVEARAAHPNFAQMPPEVDIASGHIEGSGTGIGGQIALFYQHDPRLSFGVRYMHSVKVTLDGDATFEQRSIPGVPDAMTAPFFQPGQPFGDQAVSADLTFPAQAVVGLRFAATPALALAADYQWTGWSSFDEISADFENQPNPLVLVLNYRDAHTVRLGGEYAGNHPLVVRAGFIFNTAATPDETVTPILPEAERWLLTAGLGYDFGSIRADVFYNFVNQADRRGRVRSPQPGQSGEALNVGVYESTAHLFGLTFSYGLALGF
jgi:long-chain fatty acid transport protein